MILGVPLCEDVSELQKVKNSRSRKGQFEERIMNEIAASRKRFCKRPRADEADLSSRVSVLAIIGLNRDVRNDIVDPYIL